MGTNDQTDRAPDGLEELVAEARRGDRTAFDELVRRTYADTYTLAVRLTGNEEDARDVVQEAYLRAWKGIRRFRGDSAFPTWMYRITANTAYSVVKRRRRHRSEPLERLLSNRLQTSRPPTASRMSQIGVKYDASPSPAITQVRWSTRSSPAR